MEMGIKVGDLMTRNFVYVTPETNLKECARTMVKKRVGSLIVREETKLKGILTEKDIIWAIVKKSKEDLKNILAKDLMKRKVITIKPGDDIIDAMQKFKRKNSKTSRRGKWKINWNAHSKRCLKNRPRTFSTNCRNNEN